MPSSNNVAERELKSYRTVFISDLHMGAVGCKADAIQDFLHSFKCEQLYLVGDVVDGWVMREKKWQQQHTNIIRTILGMSKYGTEIRYTPGNHDAFMRQVNGFEFGFIEFGHSFVHTTLDGKELLVVHGDLFDSTCVNHKGIAILGAWMYEIAQQANIKVNKRVKKKVDFASNMKRFVKRLTSGKKNFESLLIESAREEGFDGVICGHVHRPEIRTEPDGFVYINCGDWVEHCTAVVEEHDGTVHQIEWRMPEPSQDQPSETDWQRRRRERREQRAASGTGSVVQTLLDELASIEGGKKS